MRLIKRRQKNKEKERVLLEHDPIEQRSLLTPMRQFDYTPDAETTEALSFLASWYNSDHYANLEHERGRDSNVSGRHMLQTPYGRSRVGNRDTPYERASRIAYSPRFKNNEDLEYGTLGAWNPREGTVSIASQSAFNEAVPDNRVDAIVHELYHGAEGANRKFSDYNGDFGRPTVDQRFAQALDQSQMGVKNPYEGVDDNDLEKILELRKALIASNPYSDEDFRRFMNSYANSGKENVGLASYINEPSEVTARLREAAFTAQKLGYLDEGDFKLNDEVLNKIKTKSLAAMQLLDYSTPEQRQFYYDNL